MKLKSNRKKAGLLQLAVAAAAFCLFLPPLQVQAKPLVIARDLDVNSLDPARSWCDTCQTYNTSVYEQLVTLDKDNKILPLLATRWTVNPDQTEFTFTLDEAARFSDGSPVEAKDVKWSYERLRNLKVSASFLADPIVAIETPNNSTVVIKLSAPNSEFLNQSASGFFAVINSDVASANGAVADQTAAEKDSSEEWFLNNSAGSGPFVLEGYEPNAELRLKRNDAYWRRKPALQEVVMRHVAEAVAQAQMLQTGEVDIAMQIDPETAKSLEGTSVVIEPAPSYNFIYMALSPGAKNLPVKLTPDVREAISMAVDRTALIDFTLGGAGRLLPAPIPLGFPGSDGHALPAYDPGTAKKMLTAAGLGDGFTLDAIYPDQRMFGVDFNVMMQKLQQDLAKVGVKLELKPMPIANWREAANGDHIPLTAIYYSPDFFGSSQYVDVFGMQEGSVWANRAGGKNDPSIINPRANELKVKALAASTPDEAAKLWSEAAKEMIDSKIIFPLMSPDMLLAHGANIKGLRFSICCNPPLAEIEN